MATVPATPSTLEDMDASGLKMIAYQNKLANECQLDDVFNYLSEDVIPDPNGSEIPDAVFLRVPNSVGADSMKLGLLMDLQAAPRLGNAQHMLGYEENLRIKHTTLYHNEIKKSVASFGWGIDWNALEPYQAYKKIHPKMKKFLAEFRGRRCRECTMLTYGLELTEAPRSLTQQFTPNIFVMNTALDGMPTWDVSANTLSAAGTYPSSDTVTGDYVERIADVMMAAVDSGAHPEYANLKTVKQLLALEYYVRDILKLEPIMLDSQPSYIFLIPSNAVKIRDPGETGSLAELIKDMSGFTAYTKAIPNVIGRYGSLVFVVDGRAPTLTVGGADGSWTLTPGFLNPGGNDGRNYSAAWSNTSGSLNYVFDVGTILGRAAIVEWIVADYKYATEATEYGKFNGKGAYGLSGIQMVKYEAGTPADGVTGAGDTYQQQSSCMVIMSRAEIVEVS